ncbi:MAG: FprA family A-type flavoprotein [Bacteroidales bacterium]|jgi:anaerobic nitric oxide reductase flavorubredoxin|nr:FprA family A-type flavoprotein [Bacteroidales bacterium]
MLIKELKKEVYYVGVTVRKTHLFENLWPIPHGVSYNSYIIKDEKTALLDTVEIGQSSIFIKKVLNVLDGRKLDYLIVNHMEPDHGGSIEIIRRYFPDVIIVGNKKTVGMLEGYYGITDNILEVKEGDTLSLGRHTLNFYMAPMVHWPEVMMTYDSTEKILFSADAFGTFGTNDGGILDSELDLSKYEGEMRRYYSNIVGKYGNPVQKALAKLKGLDIDMICSLHGPVWSADINRVVSLYDQWSKYEPEEKGVVIAYGSMYGNTEEMAERVARSLSINGVKNIVIHDVSKSHSSYILSDIFRYNGLIIASPTYCNELYPEIESLLHKIKIRSITKRAFTYFGSFTWADATNKRFKVFAEDMKWDVIGNPFAEKMALKAEKTKMAEELGRVMAEAINH